VILKLRLELRKNRSREKKKEKVSLTPGKLKLDASAIKIPLGGMMPGMGPPKIKKVDPAAESAPATDSTTDKKDEPKKR